MIDNNDLDYLENYVGIKYLPCIVGESQYAFGSIYLKDNLIESSLKQGVFALRNKTTNTIQWIPAQKLKFIDKQHLILSGESNLEGTAITFSCLVSLPRSYKSINIEFDIDFSDDIDDYEICLQYQSNFNYQWKAHLYPWVADSKWVKREKLDNMGIPSLLIYRDDFSVGVLWGIDPNFDYLNPTTWTKDFGCFFTDNVVPPQFRVGDGKLSKDIHYHCPMQLIVSDENKNPDYLITDLVSTWMKSTNYKVNPLDVRDNDEALNLFIEGRRESEDAYIDGKGYSLHGANHTFLYFGVQSMGAYFDYLLFELTGDPIWRKRSFEQMNFIKNGQNLDPNDINYGAIQTTYQLEWMDDYGNSGPGFNSDDRFNVGYKPEITALLVRYMLQVWNLVKTHEGIDHQDWYQTAKLAAEWIIRQQNNDNGLPQKVQAEPLEMRWFDEETNEVVIKPFKSRSSTSGRALPSFWSILEFIKEEKYKKFLRSVETYNLEFVQNKYYFTGHHPDLPPYELEEASIWGLAEHWLNRYEESGDKDYLQHAVANAMLALTWWCPKDLSWVNNPTQLGVAEQQHFQQYSVYNYQDRKVESLWRLYLHTKDKLYLDLFERVLQNIYFTQETKGGNKGGTYERIADPWLVRDETPGGPYFDSMGTNYTNEQALDCFLQVFELFRMGEAIYGDGINNKVYSDGRCYYNKDIRSCRKLPLVITPSDGFLNIKVGSWNSQEKSLILSDSKQEEQTINITIFDLEPKIWYIIIIDGERKLNFQADQSGTIATSISLDFSRSINLSLERKN